jgi:hypothetical protein
VIRDQAMTKPVRGCTKKTGLYFPGLSPLGSTGGRPTAVLRWASSSSVPAAGLDPTVPTVTLQSITQTVQHQMSIASPSTALGHPDIAGREEIISELDGASLSSPATVIVLLILFMLAQCFGQSMAIRLSLLGICPLR